MTQTTIQLFTGNTFDTSASFLLRIRKQMYLFNIPENTQKMILVNEVKYRCIKASFITSIYPDSVGGLSTFIVQGYNQNEKLFEIIGPSQIPEVILFDADYVDEKVTSKHQFQILNSFSNEDIEVNSINLSHSISYDVFLKENNKRMLVVDCRSIDDLKLLPNIQQFHVIVHLTRPEILILKDYYSFFTSHVSTTNQIANICFMPSGIITNYDSNEYYNRRSNRELQQLSRGRTLKPPPNFIDFNGKVMYDFDSQTVTKSGKIQYVDINYGILSGLNKFDLYSKLTSLEPKIPQFKKWAITVLGSSTRFVSKEKSNSGYLIRTQYGYIAVDPSEGYVHQIQRKYGPQATKDILKNLECIWVSHFHEDHCFGVPSLLLERSKVTDKKIFFFAPQKFIDDITKISSLYGDFKVVYHNREPEGRVQSSPEDMLDAPNDLPINDHLILKSIDVYHCVKNAKGFMLVIDNDSKIAFSGDRAFQKDHFADVFKDCDLLIHEATFPDDLVQKQKSKQIMIQKHCFNFEAIETVKMMNPKFALFVHLSLRYGFKSLKYKPAANILIAFDFLEFTSENIEWIFQKCGIYKNQ